MGSPDADRYLAAVRRHADHVLQHGRGRWHAQHRDAFADALDVATDEPAIWLHPEDGRTIVPSNFANQQDWLRTLVGLSALTGESRYAEAAEAAIRHAFRHLQETSGLLHWGGHCCRDLLTGEPFGMENLHELKCHYPFYEALWRNDPPATRRFIEAFWDRHILDWRRLDLNRHGIFGASLRTSACPWSHSLELEPVFFVGEGLSFINTGSDLFYAAGMLGVLSGERGPLDWSRRLARRYAEETRHPATGLGGYQFSRIGRDRALEQLGPEFGERAHEYSVLDRTRAVRKFGVVGLCQFALAERLGSQGEAFRTWAVHDLRSFARHAFDPAAATFHAVLRDGTRLAPEDVKRPGYYRSETFAAYQPEPLLLWAYARGFGASGDAALEETTVAIARARGLGDWRAGDPRVRAETADAWTLHALLDWHRTTGRDAFLRTAVAVGENLVRKRQVGVYFVENLDQRFARVGRPEPLALLHLVAALRGVEHGVVPAQLPGERYFTAPAWGKTRTSDYLDWFPVRRIEGGGL